MSPAPHLPVAIRGALRDYDWGITNGMSEWTGVSTDGPEAELWFGAHPAAPSPVLPLDHAGPEHLTDLMAPAEVPLLTKILAAASPLSLQVHPTAALAQQWRETAEGRALLPDDVAKAEMLIALEEFVVLVGWRSPIEAGRVLRVMGAAEVVLDRVANDDPAEAIRLLLSTEQIIAGEDRWRDAVHAQLPDETSRDVMSRVAAKFPGDPGIAVAVLLQSQVLQPGDAVYLPVGVPHAYVHGKGVEVMTNSDNVLRMGLTSKVVSVDHAVSALETDLSETLIRDPRDGIYAPAGAPFAVQFCGNERAQAEPGNYRLALALTGGLEVLAGDQSWSLEVGQALVIPASAPESELSFSGRGVLVTATDAELAAAHSPTMETT